MLDTILTLPWTSPVLYTACYFGGAMIAAILLAVTIFGIGDKQ